VIGGIIFALVGGNSSGGGTGTATGTATHTSTGTRSSTGTVSGTGTATGTDTGTGTATTTATGTGTGTGTGSFYRATLGEFISTATPPTKFLWAGHGFDGVNRPYFMTSTLVQPWKFIDIGNGNVLLYNETVNLYLASAPPGFNWAMTSVISNNTTFTLEYAPSIAPTALRIKCFDGTYIAEGGTLQSFTTLTSGATIDQAQVLLQTIMG
jgi:hypothetical protein